MRPGLVAALGALAVGATFGMTITSSPAWAAEADTSATNPTEAPRPRPRVAAPT